MSKIKIESYFSGWSYAKLLAEVVNKLAIRLTKREVFSTTKDSKIKKVEGETINYNKNKKFEGYLNLNDITLLN